MSVSRSSQLSMISLSLCCLAATGQQGAVSFKHFRRYSTGEWTQEIQAYRNNAPAGPLQTSTSCSGPLSPAQASAVASMGNAAAPMCRIKVLKDEERTAEYEQVCAIGSQSQVIHSTMRSIDDRTIQMEVRQSIGGMEMSLARITTRYQGPCTADHAPPTTPLIPSIPKLPAEQCAALPEMKKQASDGLKGCSSSDTPEADRPSCVAAMKRLSDMTQQMQSQCK